MFSYVACTMTTSPSIGLVHQFVGSAGAHTCVPYRRSIHSWRAFDKGAAPVPRIHLPCHPQQETGRASKPRGLELGKTRDPGQSSRIAIHMVYAGGSEAPRAGTHIAYGRYLFYCNVKYEELLDEGGALFLADNGGRFEFTTRSTSSTLTFSTRPLRMRRIRLVSSGTAELERKAFLWERDPQSRGRQEALLWERDLSQAHPQHQEASAFAEGPDTEMGTPTFNLDDLLRVIQEQEDAEQTETEGRRVPKEEGILEVDAKISLERERILEQETLIRKMNANPLVPL